MRNFDESLESAANLPEIFEVVKEVVRKELKRGRAGLNLALADLGGGKEGLIGAFYPLGSNTIVMNKAPLLSLGREKPEWLNPYAFHILLHEYLHSLGYLDEALTSRVAYDVSAGALGEEHVATLFAQDMDQFLPYITHAPSNWKPDEMPKLEYVKGFDYSSVNYIA